MIGILTDNWALKVDVKRDGNGLITSGLVLGDIARQNQERLIVFHKGEIKENPLMGVGIADYLNGESTSGLVLEIKKQLKADGQTVNLIEVVDNTLNIDASYE